MIEVEHLYKVYGDYPAIQDVSFSVKTGEILGFLGPNGAGKTTTMRILSGYLPANSGTAVVAGYDVHQDSLAVRQRIGYLPETPPLYLDMTVESFLGFVASIKGVSAGDRSPRVDSAIQRCGLQEKRDVLIRKLSKGFKQRVGIAQAIVHDPPVIILDEPTVGLDPRQIIEVRNLIRSLAEQHTVILSTHILPEVSMTCDRITIINRGHIVATDTPSNLEAQLAGSTGYEVEIAGDVTVALQQLQAIPGVRSVEIVSAPSTTLPSGHHQLQILLEPAIDAGAAIAQALVTANLGLYELRRTRATLEDVFLQLTTQDVTDQDTTAPEEAVSSATEPQLEAKPEP